MGYSVKFELLKLLETRFNFQSHLIDEQRNWGVYQGNGTWTGSVGSVLNKVLYLKKSCYETLKTLF